MSDYTGQVEPGDPAQVRDLGPLVVRKLSVSSMHNNVYLLTSRATGEQLLIDAADEPDQIRQLIDEGTGRLDGIVTTHQHWDHVRALADVAERTGARTYAGAEDADALPRTPDVRLQHGDRIRLGDQSLDVIGLRGHTPGGVALAWSAPDGQVHLFTGDSLFPGGVGATDHYDYQSFPQLIDDVENRIFGAYDDDTWFYPGHGSDGRLGDERPQLPQWRDRGW